MRHRRQLIAVGVALTAGLLGVIAGLLAAGRATAVVQPDSAATTTITVTAGKPSEFRFTLSKTRIAAPGTVIFKVVNKGKTSHDFTIFGKKTRTIAAGKSATLKVVFKKKGVYAFKCSIDGHARLGMKGSFRVGVTKLPPPTTTTTTTTGPTCANPQSSTINVDMFEYRYTLSQNSVPVNSVQCGSVTFVERNMGGATHNIDFVGVANGIGALLSPGQNGTMTLQLKPGVVTYQCDVQDHAALGMTGQLTVTDAHG